MSMLLPLAARKALEFEEKKLPNGLTLRVLNMPQYNMVHAIYATNFGSIDCEFEQGGEVWQLPDGVAHFLEHKMFENKDGVDAFSLYAATGAAANAYTGFDRTSYVFSATNGIDENLDILLSFVSNPYFTKEKIEKEQGIIAQEIKMYDDMPEHRLLYSLLKGMYHNHPIAKDIAGTVESISEITPEILYACTNAFYNSGNMVLVAAGNITMQQLYTAVERAGILQKPAQTAKKIFVEEPQTIKQKHQEFSMPVAMPMFGMGFKEEYPKQDRIKIEEICHILTELLGGESSLLYHRLYNSGLIQPDFSVDYGSFSGALFFTINGESTQPEKVQQEILSEIENLRKNGVDKEQFEICKNMIYGATIRGMDNPERIAYSLVGSYFDGMTIAEELDILAGITIEDVQDFLQNALQQNRMSTVVIQPQE